MTRVAVGHGGRVGVQHGGAVRNGRRQSVLEEGSVGRFHFGSFGTQHPASVIFQRRRRPRLVRAETATMAAAAAADVGHRPPRGPAGQRRRRPNLRRTLFCFGYLLLLLFFILNYTRWVTGW